VFREGELALTLATQQPLAPLLVWHFNLVAQLIAKFYISKKRDRELRDMAYMQAVHETGARMTHDVKNLLQSLNALLFVIDESGEVSSARAQPLLRRQLPLIAQRLQQTLDKLNVPETVTGELTSAETWWRDLRDRYETRAVHFQSLGDLSGMLPAGLFNSASENLLQNALDKRAGEPGIDIVVTLDMQQQPVLTVTDSGSPMSAARAADIGLRPVASENGLGIGLYQLARFATMLNYVFEVASNLPGEVSFRLAPGIPKS
jgi:signal transduction histidine kinase